MELYKKHRPKHLKDIVGQPDAVRVLESFLSKKKLPHSILLSGSSGVGKTTIARILRRELGCSLTDYEEINAAESRGIDTIREIQQRMQISPMDGPCRIWTIDEAARLTNDSQSALLKMLEDTPDHVYFFLATTDPQKLLPTIRNRCTEIKLRPFTLDELFNLLIAVTQAEKGNLTDEVCKSIADAADGSARKALVILDSVIGLKDAEQQLEAIQKADSKKQTIDLCRALLENKPWNQMASILKNLDDEPENVRRAVLGYMTTVVLSGGPKASRAAGVIAMFEKNWYDAGRASMVAVCWELCVSRK